MTDLFQALAHPVRRAVLKKLRSGPLSAGELADEFPVSKPTMSRHFATLRDAGLIQAERIGTTIRYRLNVSVAEEAMSALMSILGAGKSQAHENEREKEQEQEKE
ncbi:MAG TPA: metalloregulator ArsR/SmtB family transcription factor [Wenzhouxiangella sp.]|nr:metalloregulator ArsR/SmtB family transcription factor [Wenzhouxiangella sp.]